MEQTNKCLVVGLQDTGKSTYLAAFWAIEKDGDTGHKLTFDSYPDDTRYLDAIGNLWMAQEPVGRSAINSQELEFNLKHTDTGEKIKLAIPDFKGERFKLILQNEVPEEIEKWMNEVNKIIFFLPPTNERVFNEEVGESTTEKEGFTPGEVFDVDAIEPWIQNIELLKFIYENIGDVKISFCVSKWDTKLSKGIEVKKWIKLEHLFFYTFVKHHFSEVRYFGVSAQGLSYEDRGDLSEDKVSELTDQRKRAYISTGTDRNYDITLPLAWLLEE